MTRGSSGTKFTWREELLKVKKGLLSKERSRGVRSLIGVLVFVVLTWFPGVLTAETFNSLVNLSLSQYQGGQFEACIETARQALQVKPDSDVAYNNICAAHNALRQWDKGIEACGKAIELNPNNQLAKNNLAWAESQKGGLSLSQIWKGFLKVDYLTPHTVNFIDPPKLLNMSFLPLLYIFILLLTAGISLFFKSRQSGSVLKAFLLASAIGAILFAARMDYTWLMWWKKDVRELSRLDPAARLSLLEAYNVYGFADEIKRLVPQNERVRLFTGDEDDRNKINGRYEVGREYLTESYCRSKIKYHLLPLQLSDKGNYIAVFRDRRIHFDPSDNSLREENNVIADRVELVKAFGNDSFLYNINRGETIR